ncbi:cysteine hydrolase family protein [Achromobacter aegrifaciens]|uniref:cysteine hydrolase family protein n=1 Tax=Achromobacter aegrifaciens TaxID=1287736 RepID=UPI0028AA7CB6|nr:isochorismatase family protein [Achromobacter aegrifaciens]
MKQALIVIDVQDSFRQRPFWDEAEYPAFVEQIQSLIDAAQARDIPVLQVFHTSVSNDPANPFSMASGHVKTLKELRIEPTAVFHKTVHSSLYAKDADGASLQDWLVKHGIEGIIVSGIRTEQCCETTSRHASDAGYKVVFPTDATLTFAMQSPSGQHYTPAEIRDRTELVLQGRFARIARAADALAP